MTAPKQDAELALASVLTTLLFLVFVFSAAQEIIKNLDVPQ